MTSKKSRYIEAGLSCLNGFSILSFSFIPAWYNFQNKNFENVSKSRKAKKTLNRTVFQKVTFLPSCIKRDRTLTLL